MKCLTQVEQVECADYVVLNKSDMLTDKAQQEQLASIIASLNPLSTVVPCEHGKVPVDIVFGSSTQGVMAKLNVEGQHRGAVAAAKALQHKDAHVHDGHHSHTDGHHHGHDHEHSHADDGKEHADCKVRFTCFRMSSYLVKLTNYYICL